jgi:hypothetical protein
LLIKLEKIYNYKHKQILEHICKKVSFDNNNHSQLKSTHFCLNNLIFEILSQSDNNDAKHVQYVRFLIPGDWGRKNTTLEQQNSLFGLD